MHIKKIIDISRTIKNGMTVWPGDKGVSLEQSMLIQQGDVCNLSSVNMGVHTGTHADAPLHFIDGGRDIASVDLERFIGFVRVFELDVEKCITKRDIEALQIGSGDAVFLKTANSSIPEDLPFNENFIYLDASASEYLADIGIRTLGVDYLSIDSYSTHKFDAHHQLLSRNIGIIEGLCLKEVTPGEYLFSCLPLKMTGSDGSPVRAVLLEIEC